VTTPTGPGITTPVQVPSFLGAVRQQNPVGQNLNANPNVFAPAGVLGDKWGANGGDQVAVGGGATDQTGYLKPVAVTPASCETATNFLDSLPLATTNVPTPATRLGRLNSDALPGQTADPLSSVGNNAG
jgi:hypothetical protein